MKLHEKRNKKILIFSTQIWKRRTYEKENKKIFNFQYSNLGRGEALMKKEEENFNFKFKFEEAKLLKKRGIRKF
jgi:hypothetical protein